MMIFIIQTEDGKTTISVTHNAAMERCADLIEEHKDFIFTSFDDMEYNNIEIQGITKKQWR